MITQNVGVIRVLLLALAAAQAGFGATGTTINPTVPGFTAYVGNSFSQTFTCTGCGTAAITWQVAGSLPAGLSLNGSTGVLSGVPTTPQSGLFVIQIWMNAVNINSQSYTFNIYAHMTWLTANPLSPATAGTAFTRTVQVSANSVWYLTGNTMPAGVSVNLPSANAGPAASITITGTFPAVTAPTTYSVHLYATSTVSTEMIDAVYSIVANPAPALSSIVGNGELTVPYSGSVTASGGTPALTYSISGGSLPSGLALNPANGAITGTLTQVGPFSFSVTVTDANGATAKASYAITVVAAPAITTPSLAGGKVGVAYSAALTATNGVPPYAWAIASGGLPPGLALTASTGAIAGTPTQAGTYGFSVTVTDSSKGTGAATFSVAIASSLAITSTSLPAGQEGLAYTATLAATGGTAPYSWAITAGNLPAGTSLTAATGVIGGAPTAAGSFPLTVQVTDSTGATASASLTLSVSASAIAIATASLPNAQVGQAYSVTLVARGGNPPYTWTLDSGTLPSGITLAQGVLAGTPAAGSAGTYTLVVRVTDTSITPTTLVNSATKSLTLVVNPIPVPSISTSTLPGGTVGQSYSATLAATGGTTTTTTTYTWSVTAGTLPAGLSLSTAGVLSGTPTAASSGSFTVTVTDALAQTASKSFTISIAVPALPSVSVTQLSDTTTSASLPPPAFGVTLSQAYPLDLTGTATLTFKPASGPVDPAVLFANGQTTMTFSIPAGQTSAAATAGGTMAFQTGTTAGTITLTIVLSAGGVTLSPNPAATRTITIANAAPVLTSIAVSTTSTGFNITALGYSNTREIVSTTVTFTAGAGASLTPSTFSVPVSSAFQAWFAGTASASFGGQFLLTIPFTVSQGSASSLTSVQVTLTNTVGSGSGSGSGTF